MLGLNQRGSPPRGTTLKYELVSRQPYHSGSSGISPSEGSVHPPLEELNPILPFRGFDDLLRIFIEHIHRAAIVESRIR